MKKLLIVLFVASQLLPGCDSRGKTENADKGPAADPGNEFLKLNTFLQKFEEPPQIFKAPSDQLIKVKGKQGTIIHINSADLETESGEPIGQEVNIELKELSTRQQLIRANAQTVSDGKLLVSGGACYINITSEGKQVKLKTGKEYAVEFPILSEDEMSLYYGQRDSTGKMNWIQGNTDLTSRDSAAGSTKEYNAIIITGQGRYADTASVTMKNMSKEENEKIQHHVRISNMVYSPAPLNKFGWINCDRFYNADAKRTNIRITLNNKMEDVNYASVYLIFEDIKSVLQTALYFHNDTIDGNGFNNIPEGMKVKFLAVSYQHEKIFATLTEEIHVRENHDEKLTLKEMTEGEFNIMIKNIQ